MLSKVGTDLITAAENLILPRCNGQVRQTSHTRQYEDPHHNSTLALFIIVRYHVSRKSISPLHETLHHRVRVV